MASWDIHTTGIIEWLEEYEGQRFHAILSDPPYALISIAKRFGPGQAPAQEGEDGRYQRLSSGFMGQTWDGFESLEAYQDWVAEWSTLLISKALHPGAVCLFFGGTRTFHHLGVGLERGGFEIVDSVLIPWLHGQGFPKSHDISKGMDKAAGADREVVGKRKQSFGLSPNLGWNENKLSRKIVDIDITDPATEDAETWDGYGTALKPAWEPVYVCRAPRGDMTFAELAIQYGTGALNIDGTRIGNSERPARVAEDHNLLRVSYAEGAGSQGGSRAVGMTNLGRWPANLVLSHHEACVKVGEYETKGRVINRWKAGMLPFGGGAGKEYETIDPSREGEASAERTYEHEGGTDFKMKPGARRGMEMVDLYACVPGCPVRELDDQVGELASGQVKEGYKRHTSASLLEGGGNEWQLTGFGDRGGPSRFFYTAKAGRAEKDKGLENFYWRRTNDGWERVSEEEWAELDESIRGRGCIHPTVKPLELLRYLATLVLPPSRDEERRLLVPFSGSGSEMIAAMQAGWDKVEGVEMAETYTEMAEARIRATIGML